MFIIEDLTQSTKTKNCLVYSVCTLKVLYNIKKILLNLDISKLYTIIGLL